MVTVKFYQFLLHEYYLNLSA